MHIQVKFILGGKIPAEKLSYLSTMYFPTWHSSFTFFHNSFLLSSVALEKTSFIKKLVSFNMLTFSYIFCLSLKTKIFAGIVRGPFFGLTFLSTRCILSRVMLSILKCSLKNLSSSSSMSFQLSWRDFTIPSAYILFLWLRSSWIHNKF